MPAPEGTRIIGVGRRRHEDGAVGLVMDLGHADEGLHGGRADAVAWCVVLALHDHAAPLWVRAGNVRVEIAGATDTADMAVALLAPWCPRC